MSAIELTYPANGDDLDGDAVEALLQDFKTQAELTTGDRIMSGGITRQNIALTSLDSNGGAWSAYSVTTTTHNPGAGVAAVVNSGTALSLTLPAVSAAELCIVRWSVDLPQFTLTSEVLFQVFHAGAALVGFDAPTRMLNNPSVTNVSGYQNGRSGFAVIPGPVSAATLALMVTEDTGNPFEIGAGSLNYRIKKA